MVCGVLVIVVVVLAVVADIVDLLDDGQKGMVVVVAMGVVVAVVVAVVSGSGKWQVAVAVAVVVVVVEGTIDLLDDKRSSSNGSGTYEPREGVAPGEWMVSEAESFLGLVNHSKQQSIVLIGGSTERFGLPGYQQ